MNKRSGLLITALLMAAPLVTAPDLRAQTTPRFQAGPVVRFERVAYEGGASGDATVAGVAASMMLTKHFGVEGDVTQASSLVTRSYTAIFTSYAPAGSSIAEIEAQGVLARRDLIYESGTGGSVALIARAKASEKVDFVFRLGGAFRQTMETSKMTILSMPEGKDPQVFRLNYPDEHGNSVRGGLLLGVDVPIRLTRSMTVSPEFRFVSGGNPNGRKSYREVSMGAQVMWRF